MNAEYVYLQLYKLFDKNTPLTFDCGRICNKACCKGDDCGMYLFPQEESVYKLLNPDWAKIEKSDFTYNNEKEKNTKILFCNGDCDRYQRPLACRIFPLTPYINKDNKLEIIIDPRAKSVCPVSTELAIGDFDTTFVKNVRRTFNILIQNKEVYAFLVEYSKMLDEYLKFF